MSFEEQFDKIINQKINEAEFPFDEKNWERASNLIEANRLIPVMNKSKNLWLLSLLFMAVLGAGIFVYVKLNETGVVAKKSNAVKNTSKQNRPANNSIQSLMKEVDPLLNTAPIDEEKVLKSEGNLQNGNKNVFVSKNKNNPSNTNSLNHLNALAVGVLSQNSNASDKKQSNNSSNETHVQESVINTGYSNATNLKALKKQNSVSNASRILAVIGANNKNPVTVDSSTQNVLQSAAFEQKPEAPVFEPINAILFKSESLNNEKECVNLSSDFSSVYDNDYYRNNKPKFNYLNIETGAAYMFGWDGSSGKDAVGFNYYGGIDYGVYLNPKTDISGGVQWSNINNIHQAFFTSAKTVYDFGSIGSYTNITTNTLYYISVPIRVNYLLSSRNKIGLGLLTGFLAGSKNTVETYSLSDGVKSVPVITENKGIYEGVNTKNFVISALYSRKLNKRFALNAEINYGISDIYQNTRLNNTKQNLMALRLGLVFTLFDK